MQDPRTPDRVGPPFQIGSHFVSGSKAGTTFQAVCIVPPVLLPWERCSDEEEVALVISGCCYKEITWQIGGRTDWHFGPETSGRSANPSYDQTTDLFFSSHLA